MEQPPTQPPAPPEPGAGAPVGWQQQVGGPLAAANPYAVKRSLGRCWGFAVLSFGLWTFFWFHNYRKLIDGEKGEGRDDALLHTFGLLVPILNYFIIYWLWRDVDIVRRRVGLNEFPVVPYVVGAVFIAPVFYSLVNEQLNQYWDARTQGLATDAPVTTGEKVFLGIGIAIFALYLLIVIVAIIVAATAGSS